MALPLLALLATGAAAALPAPITADLDGDGAAEQLVQRETRCFTQGVRHPPPCAADDVRYEQASVVDDCGRIDLLEASHEAFVDARTVDADGRPARPEVLVEGYSGASGRVGEARLLRIAPGCRAPRVLLQIPDARWRTARPRGAASASTGFLTVADLEPRRPGREVVLRQAWYRASDGGCCPTWSATAVFGYRAATDRYVLLRRRVARVG